MIKVTPRQAYIAQAYQFGLVKEAPGSPYHWVAAGGLIRLTGAAGLAAAG